MSVIALPALLLASLLIFQSYRNERAAVADKLLNTARAVASVVDGEVDDARTLLKTLAATPEVASGDLDAIDPMARRALDGDARWFVLTEAGGQQLVNTRVPRGTPLPRVTDLEPELVAAMREQREFVSDLREGPVTRALVVHISRPQQSPGAGPRILSVAMLPNAMASALDVERFASGGVVSVLDRRGRIIARNKNAERFIGQHATPDIVAATTTRTEGIQDSVTLEGIPVLAAFSRARCGWSVAIGAPTAELYRSARRLLVWGAGCAALLVLGAVGMAWWIGRSLVRGVDTLTGDAEAMARGQMPAERSSGLEETDFVASAMRRTAGTLLRRTQTLEILNRVNAVLVAERDLEKIVQSVTDAGREASGAAFGAFFYNVENASGESYMLYTLSGAPRDAFERFGMPRNTPVFGPTFAGEGVVRVADITADPRYGKMAPHHGMPTGHLPVRSYLAVPVKSRTGEVIGGLFFGHPEVGVFTDEAERVVVGLAAEAAIAIDNAKLYRALALELEAKSKAEAELRLAQQRLHEHAQDLERKVEERTASLREAMTQMEEFSYTVSHDLRSPLRSMNSFAGILMEDYGPQLDETGRDHLRRIMRASERMDRMTTDLLNYTRVARAQVELVPTDVTRIVQATVEHYTELQPPAEVRVEEPLHRVVAHEASLTQCIGNLMTNAAKFVKPGEPPRITVRTERRAERVRIWIEDQGIGIAPEHQAVLFQIFERAPTNDRYEGTGIGLAIVRKAAEKMGGSCGVESDGKSGSRFWIELGAA